jgi:hypothetical protein
MGSSFVEMGRHKTPLSHFQGWLYVLCPVQLGQTPSLEEIMFNDASVRVERSVLYEQVWAEAMVNVAKKYGVSDVALAKICRKLTIPVPGRVLAKKTHGETGAASTSLAISTVRRANGGDHPQSPPKANE